MSITDIPEISKITVTSFIEFVKNNPDKIKIIDFLWILNQEKYSHLKSEILNLKFSDFAQKQNNIVSQDECEKQIISLYGRIVKLSISEIQNLLENCDRTILLKSLKFLEQKNSYGFRMASFGRRKGRKYSLVKEEDYKEDELDHLSDDD